MQSLNQYRECALGTSGEARAGMHCGTDPAHVIGLDARVSVEEFGCLKNTC